MSWATSEVVAVLTFLLPGFVGAAVFYSLTSHPKPGEFDRVVQALVFTTVGQAVAWLTQALAGLRWEHAWPAGLELTVAVLSAVAVALLAVYVSNHDIIHGALRRIGVTGETSYPSELYSAFAEHPDSYVVLPLRGDRRLYGWVEEWPSRPPNGYFRISEAIWLDGEKPTPSTGVIAVLVRAIDVEMIEFLEGEAVSE
jgi:hypothetical protein